jgi:hypothetical protein
MRYAKKIPPADKELRERLLAEGWKRLKEPSNLVAAILLSAPFMVVNGIISLAIAYYLYPPFREAINLNGFSLTINGVKLLLYVVGVFIFLAIHEFIHACFIPDVLKSDKTYWGINGLFGFVSTAEKIKKGRYLIISVMPFILLSLVLPFILKFMGWLNGYTVFLCLINAAGSCVDCLNICLIAIQVPRGAYIVSNGWETYFK